MTRAGLEILRFGPTSSSPTTGQKEDACIPALNSRSAESNKDLRTRSRRGNGRSIVESDLHEGPGMSDSVPGMWGAPPALVGHSAPVIWKMAASRKVFDEIRWIL